MLEIRPYERRDWVALEKLFFHSQRAFINLEWFNMETWFATYTDVVVLLAWQGPRLVGLIGCPPPLNGTAWVRLLAIHEEAAVVAAVHAADSAPTDDGADAVLSALWAALCTQLRAMGVRQVCVFMLRDWLSAALPALGFAPLQALTLLRRAKQPLPPLPSPDSLQIEQITYQQVPQLAAIDHAAFEPPWQMSLIELREARRNAAFVTIAYQDDQPIGYQLSTQMRDQAHLARIAVVPSAQGQQVAAYLLADVLHRFDRRHTHAMTVNTTVDNLASLRLYARFGFVAGGLMPSVWSVLV
jgi:ribosomal protein S18 acetylase RimI-like enzyme